jgi:hypothetical protein
MINHQTTQMQQNDYANHEDLSCNIQCSDHLSIPRTFRVEVGVPTTRSPRSITNYKILSCRIRTASLFQCDIIYRKDMTPEKCHTATAVQPRFNDLTHQHYALSASKQHCLRDVSCMRLNIKLAGSNKFARRVVICMYRSRTLFCQSLAELLV